MLKRTIPKIVMEYTWESSPVESIIISDFTIPKEIIPDMIHNIRKFFKLADGV